MGCRLHDPCNIVLMQKQLEKRFDKWEWTIIPEGPELFRVGFVAVGLGIVGLCSMRAAQGFLFSCNLTCASVSNISGWQATWYDCAF